ncbi:hypothetical protein FAM09_19275 [Niastella caeni]|uniref:Uncharacterized protein n=1 Tax=Niastella caeni TaxID=2569763 RepID=A0A4S8HPB3_9BACT|nr:DUF5691 domain-containing protein [Niastella caeni]THU37095.1 hypothetical protein FAM09_19275 [Niastella caeni]
MQTWEQIINTAMLGTGKRTLGVNEMPPALADAVVQIQHNTTDKEEQFLQMAALAFNFRQCGILPLQKEGVTIDKAAVEEKRYCSALAKQTLKDILDSESNSLLQFWLQQCKSKEQVVTPELVPLLLSVATQQKKLQNLIVACCGKRGDWLSRFNPEWDFSTATTDEEIWQTGTPEQRKMVLEQLRQADPATARSWVQQTWAQEDANTKVEFLVILGINIGSPDIEFLETLSKEKSRKVKDFALWLLKQIPGSPIVQQYWQVLQEAVTNSHKGIKVHLPASLDDNIFKTGIEKLSNNKEYTDEEFIVSQLMQSVPPASWEAHFQNTPDVIIRYLQKDKVGKKLLPALVQAVVTFKDQRWATAFMQNSSVFYIDIIPLLPVNEQEFYSIKFIGQFAENIIEHAIKREDTWGVDLARAIFIHTAQNVYQYNRSFYSRYIHCIPVAIVTELEKCAPTEEYQSRTWSNTSEYITTLINLKKQTIQSFND